jgi:hypothetical protein
MTKIAESLNERIGRRRFVSRLSKAAFAGTVGIGTLLGSSGTAFARTCNCCTLDYATNCNAKQQEHCKGYYVWSCGPTSSQPGCTCTCYDCHSHHCSLTTCSGTGCTSC